VKVNVIVVSSRVHCLIAAGMLEGQASSLVLFLTKYDAQIFEGSERVEQRAKNRREIQIKIYWLVRH
jgi:hypothetical protein